MTRGCWTRLLYACPFIKTILDVRENTVQLNNDCFLGKKKQPDSLKADKCISAESQIYHKYKNITRGLIRSVSTNNSDGKGHCQKGVIYSSSEQLLLEIFSVKESKIFFQATCACIPRPVSITIKRNAGVSVRDEVSFQLWGSIRSLPWVVRKWVWHRGLLLRSRTTPPRVAGPSPVTATGKAPPLQISNPGHRKQRRPRCRPPAALQPFSRLTQHQLATQFQNLPIWSFFLLFLDLLNYGPFTFSAFIPSHVSPSCTPVFIFVRINMCK